MDPTAVLKPRTSNLITRQDVDLAELFSGSATLSKEFFYEGKEVAACDYKYGRGMDILKPSGFG